MPCEAPAAMGAGAATKGVEKVMKTLLGSCLVAISLFGFGERPLIAGGAEGAEQIKKEIIKIDEEKVHALNSNDPSWFRRVYADDIVVTGVGYGGRVGKDNVVDGFQSQAHQLQPGSVHHDARQVHVYNGDTAVLTYIGNGVAQMNGKTATVHTWTTDVYAKVNGAWREVVHHVTAIPAGMNP